MLAAGALVATLTLAPTPKISDVWQSSLDDVSFLAKVESVNKRELAKIKNDVALTYKVDSIRVQAKEPFRLRLDSTIKVAESDSRKGVVIFNGSKTRQQLFGLPTLRDDFARKPGRRQTIFDFGLVTPSLFNGFFEAKFVRVDRKTGDYVFDVTYATRLDDDTRHRIWVDPAKKYVTRREWYSQMGNRPLLAVFTWESPVKVGGVWIPTRVVARNPEGKVAGTMRFTDIRVNTGLPESLFAVN